MKKIIAVLLCAAITLVALPALTGCTSGDTLYVLNWGDYLEDSLKDRFKKEYGVTIKEKTVTSNEEMLVLLEADDCPYDLCIPSDYAVERLISGGRLSAINKSNVPNIENIDDRFMDLAFDPNNTYSVPYTWGVLGVLYNKTMVDESDLGSWDILWNSKYSNKIYMYDSIRDSMAVALLYLGYDINSTDEAELNAAADALIAQKPLVKAYLTDDVKDSMILGDGALAVVYSGDAVWCCDPDEGNPDLDFFVPESGSNIYFDNMVIPVNSQKQELAEKFVNFLLDPEIGAINTEYIGYSSPNAAVLPLLDKYYQNNPIFNISDGIVARCVVFRDLGTNIALYSKAWDRVFG